MGAGTRQQELRRRRKRKAERVKKKIKAAGGGRPTAKPVRRTPPRSKPKPEAPAAEA
jgi:hypothetical protein